MIEIFRRPDSALLGHLQGLLESAGIRTYLRNEYASSTTLAIPEVTPTLCILDEGDRERSVNLIREYLEDVPASSGEDWTCPDCRETSPGTFEVCWKCGASLGVAS
ncbi:hypothetical protein HNR46_003309 [Haloferula luteola]|uniref:DUF2007 domain-containing protein n=1 Tax=Haloferula luteola TaxID=595692 RepID=A0A840V7N5_9BACT|nr:DUF2007 domain-containing protein [Haloferula luteola]MBB5353056.1 hypothetical protein [Haloferula luteola]